MAAKDTEKAIAADTSIAATGSHNLKHHDCRLHRLCEDGSCGMPQMGRTSGR